MPVSPTRDLRSHEIIASKSIIASPRGRVATTSRPRRSRGRQADPLRGAVRPGRDSRSWLGPCAQELTTQLGQSVYVENKAGGAGTIAMSDVKNSPPDGYTIILGTWARSR